jgi:histidinol-phosphate aminotransferase
MSSTLTLAERLQRAHLRDLVPYASARRSMSGGAIWLNANEAPYTPSAAGRPDSNRYPAFQSSVLNQAYADYAGVEAAQVLSGRGSDEAIELLIRAFCEPNRDSILICPPTYGMYAISAQTHGCATVQVPLVQHTEGNWQLDLTAIENNLNNVKLVFVCSPSNPLGNQLDSADLRSLLELVGERALVVVDEAYIEFTATDGSRTMGVASWLQTYPQLVVLRTLSKAFGLAALRCGFVLAASTIIAVLQKVIAPYPLSQPSIDGAIAALQTAALEAMWQLRDETEIQRQRLLQALQQRSWVRQIYPSVTNFVLLQVSAAEALVKQLSEQGILIRNQSQQLGLANCVRISIGSATELDQLIARLPA